MDLANAVWRKSSRSQGSNNCVEFAVTSYVVGVRDTKDRSLGYFTADRDQWQEFLGAVKSDRFT